MIDYRLLDRAMDDDNFFRSLFSFFRATWKLQLFTTAFIAVVLTGYLLTVRWILTWNQ